MKIAIGFFCLVISASAGAVNLGCYRNPITDAVQCIDENNVRERQGIRSSALYSGGPNNVRDTGFTINVNCSTERIHIKDRDGVSFAGGDGSETAALRELRRLVCSAKPRK